MDSFLNSHFFADFRDENYIRNTTKHKTITFVKWESNFLTLTKKKIQFRGKIRRGYTGRRSRVRLRTALELFHLKMEPHVSDFSLNLDLQDSENETTHKRIIKMTDEELEKSIDALFFSRLTRYMTRTPDWSR